MRYLLAPIPDHNLGQGTYGWVFKATDVDTGRVVAIKQSRASLKLKRPILQHEARILQLLQGHESIPIIYGYGRIEHFEVISMEILGQSVEECKAQDAGTPIGSVLQLLKDTLSGLQHIHSKGIVHRDIKPDNLLCTSGQNFPVKIVDFGISKAFHHHPPVNDNPLQNLVGTSYWASINSHNGIDLRPRDDLESLAYTALYLVRGSLPWKPHPGMEDVVITREIMQWMKKNCNGTMLSDAQGFPVIFGKILDYSRALAHDQLPDYRYLGNLLESESLPGYTTENTQCPTDWTPSKVPERIGPHLSVGGLRLPPTLAEITRLLAKPVESVGLLPKPDDSVGLPPKPVETHTDPLCSEDSYYGRDMDIWDRMGERDTNLTLSPSCEEELDNQLGRISEFIRDVQYF